MNKFFKLLLLVVAISATTSTLVSCLDSEENETEYYHNGGRLKS